MTLKQFAEDLGLSPSTVSRTLNQDSKLTVSDATRNRILEYALETGYTQRSYKSKKRVMNNRKTRITYVSTAPIDGIGENPFTRILYGVRQELATRGQRMDGGYTTEELEDSAVMIDLLNSADIEGIVMIGPVPYDQYVRISQKKKVVMAPLDFYDDVDCVTTEMDKATYKLTTAMIENGHRSIAYIGGFIDWDERLFGHNDLRLHGYLKALLDNHIPINRDIIKPIDWSIEMAYQVMQDMLNGKEPVTAVIAASDDIALGAINAILSRGFEIPKDFSISGFDNLRMSEYLTPPLTTVDYYHEDIGAEAVRLLFERMASERKIRKKIVLPVNIIQRGSIASINAPPTDK